MTKRLYVGNIPYTTDEGSLRDLFTQYGEVASVDIPTDRETGRPRGFAFVDMVTDAGAASAIENLDGYRLDSRSIRVNEAKPRSEAATGRQRF